MPHNIAEKTKVGGSYLASTLHSYAKKNSLAIEFAGRDIYDKGEPSQFLTLSHDETNYMEQYVWDGHYEGDGPLYRRVS